MNPILKKFAAVITILCFATQVQAAPAFSSAMPAQQEMGVPANLGLETGMRVSVPENLASVESFSAGKEKMIFHIQNAHGHYEGEQKTEQLLRYLEKEYGVKTILAEGAWNKLNPELIRFTPNKKENAKILEQLTQKAILKGFETHLLNSPKSTGYGIEEEKLYNEGLMAFAKTRVLADKHANDIAQVETNLQARQAKAFSKDLRQLVSRIEKHALNQIPFDKYLHELKSMTDKHFGADLGDAKYQKLYPQLVRIFKIEQIEKTINAQAFESEKAEFLKSIYAVLGTRYKQTINEVERLLALKDLSAKLPNPGTAEFFLNMIQRLPPNFPYKRFQNVTHFFGLLILRSEIDAETLIAEVEKLETELMNQLADTDESKKLVSEIKSWWITKKLIALELTPSEFEQIRQTNDQRLSTTDKNTPVIASVAKQSVIPAKAGIQSITQSALNFYSIAKQRDTVMLRRIEERLRETKADKVAVITGGFHAGPFADYFKKRGYSYAEIMPKLTDLDDTGRNEYINVMMHFAKANSQQLTADSSSSGVTRGLSRGDAEVAQRVSEAEQSASARASHHMAPAVTGLRPAQVTSMVAWSGVPIPSTSVPFSGSVRATRRAEPPKAKKAESHKFHRSEARTIELSVSQTTKVKALQEVLNVGFLHMVSIRFDDDSKNPSSVKFEFGALRDYQQRQMRRFFTLNLETGEIIDYARHDAAMLTTQDQIRNTSIYDPQDYSHIQAFLDVLRQVAEKAKWMTFVNEEEIKERFNARHGNAEFFLANPEVDYPLFIQHMNTNVLPHLGSKTLRWGHWGSNSGRLSFSYYKDGRSSSFKMGMEGASLIISESNETYDFDGSGSSSRRITVSDSEITVAGGGQAEVMGQAYGRDPSTVRVAISKPALVAIRFSLVNPQIVLTPEAFDKLRAVGITTFGPFALSRSEARNSELVPSNALVAPGLSTVRGTGVVRSEARAALGEPPGTPGADRIPPVRHSVAPLTSRVRALEILRKWTLGVSKAAAAGKKFMQRMARSLSAGSMANHPLVAGRKKLFEAVNRTNHAGAPKISEAQMGQPVEVRVQVWPESFEGDELPKLIGAIVVATAGKRDAWLAFTGNADEMALAQKQFEDAVNAVGGLQALLRRVRIFPSTEMAVEFKPKAGPGFTLVNNKADLPEGIVGGNARIYREDKSSTSVSEDIALALLYVLSNNLSRDTVPLSKIRSLFSYMTEMISQILATEQVISRAA